MKYSLLITFVLIVVGISSELRFLQSNTTNTTIVNSNVTHATNLTSATPGAVSTNATNTTPIAAVAPEATNNTSAVHSNTTNTTTPLTAVAPTNATNTTTPLTAAAPTNATNTTTPLTSSAPSNTTNTTTPLTSAAPTNETSGNFTSSTNATNATNATAGAIPGTNQTMSGGAVPVPLSSYILAKHDNITLTPFKKNQLNFLVDQNGQSLYLFENDLARFTSCMDRCAQMWPPVLVKNDNSTFVAIGGNKTLAGTLTRPNGDKQVTYNGWPLYYYTLDKTAGDINGHGIYSYGGVWWLLNPNGRPETSQLYNATLNNPGAMVFPNNANIGALPTS
jgi:predicted lipoprotein with Yx(FWY)xxD motif